MIINAAKQLHAAKMAVFDERSGNLFVTELGRVASHFYIRWDCISPVEVVEGNGKRVQPQSVAGSRQGPFFQRADCVG
jgi:hypothetical protein